MEDPAHPLVEPVRRGRPWRCSRHRGRRWKVTPLLTGLLLVPVALLGHQLLTASDPPADAVLDELPRELRLTFSEPVRLALSAVELLDADGSSLTLSEPRVSETSDRVLVAEVLDSSGPGDYRVSWRTTGADGHVVQGGFGFRVRVPDGVADAGVGPETDGDTVGGRKAEGEVPSEAPDTRQPLTQVGESRGFTAASPLFVLTRWVTLAGLLAVIGALALRWGILPLARRRFPGSLDPGSSEPGRFTSGGPVAHRAAGLGIVAGGIVALLAPVRLFLQAVTVTGTPASVDLELLRVLATTGPWGVGWMLQFAGGALAVVGFALARRRPGAGWSLAAVAGAALALSPALSGHAVGGGGGTVALHAMHILVAGVWLGGLALLLVTAIPAARDLGAPNAGEAVRALVGGFSLLAMVSVTLLLLTGAPAAFRLVGSLDGLIGTRYGQVLLLKLAAFLLMGSLGAYHALRLKPRLDEDRAVQQLGRTGRVEVGMGLVILLITAVLVALQPTG